MGRLCVPDQPDTTTCTGSHDDRQVLSQDLCGILYSKLMQYLSCLVGKPTLWVPNKSDTNRAVQSQKKTRDCTFWI